MAEEMIKLNNLEEIIYGTMIAGLGGNAIGIVSSFYERSGTEISTWGICLFASGLAAFAAREFYMKAKKDSNNNDYHQLSGLNT